MNPRIAPDTVAFLRSYLERHPDDVAAQLRLGCLLVTHGEQTAARTVLERLEHRDGATGERATAELATLDEVQGHLQAAVMRWERLLANDIDHREARAHITRLRGACPAMPPSSAFTSAAPTLASPEGVHLLRYEIVREIGRGATATVYLVRDRALELPLALKVLHPQLAAASNSEACRRFFAEARLVAALRHPGVVAIYDVDEPARALVMELMSGGTLRERLRSASAEGPPIALTEVNAIAQSLLEALAHLHARGVVHGDITPRNVLLRRPGQAVLVDFGSARLVASPSDPSGGTPLYLAPEQFRGAPSLPATDLFSAGAVIWEALAGRPLRQHTDLLTDRFGSAPLPAEVRAALPPEAMPLVRLVDALVSVDTTKRPADAREALGLLL